MSENENLTPAGGLKPYVSLIGCDGNAFAIMGKVAKALKENGHTKEDVNMYRKEAMSGNYDNLLLVSLKWSTEED